MNENKKDNINQNKLHQNQRSYLQISSSMISGGLAGVAAKSFTAPFDRIKILFISRSKKFNYNQSIIYAKQIMKKEGIFGFWRGNTMTILRILPYSSIQFSTFDYLKHYIDIMFKKDQKEYKLLIFASGATAGIVATSITYPLEFLRTRFAMEKGEKIYKNLRNAVTTIINKEKGLVFYNGLLISLIGIIPYHGTGFLIYDILKYKLRQNYPSLSKNMVFDFLFGASAGIIAQIISYPFDVIRKRMQGQGYLLQTGEITYKKSMLEISKQIYKQEGFFYGFFKGFTLNIIKSPIATGIAWTTKNIINRALDDKFEN